MRLKGPALSRLVVILTLASAAPAAQSSTLEKVERIHTFSEDFELVLKAVELNGLVYFAAVHRAEAGSRNRLWASDGTPEGTRNLADYRWSLDLAALGERVFFPGEDSNGVELWASDGTPEGTGPVTDIALGAADARPQRLTVFDGRLFFLADAERAYESRLWVSDGSPDGTKRFAEFNPGGSAVRDLTVMGSRLYVRGADSEGIERLWFIDEGSPQAFLVAALPAGRTSPVAHLGTRIVFRVNHEFWSLDPDLQDPQLLGAAGQGEFVWNGRLYSVIFRAEIGFEPWVTDGTPQGSRLLQDLAPGPASSCPWDFLDAGEQFFFLANTDAAGRELWVSDGTVEGTRMVKDIRPGHANSRPVALTRLKERVVFWAQEDEGGAEPWISDGTAQGTQRLLDVRKGPDHSVRFLTAFPPPVDPSGEEFLLVPDARSSVVSEKLYFAADDGSSGTELWVSDGSSPETRLALDLAEGGESSFPNFFGGAVTNFSTPDIALENAGDFGRSFFVAQKGDSFELWRVVPERPAKAAPLVVPVSSGLDDGFTGIAVLNAGVEHNSVMVKGLDFKGAFLGDSALGESPLPPLGQRARLAEEIDPLAEVLRIGMEGSPLEGFFMLGDGAASRIDGVGGRPRQARTLLVPLVRLSPAEQSILFLHNADPIESAQAQITFRDQSGNSFAGNWTFPPSGSLRSELNNLLGFQGLLFSEGYLQIESDRPLQGFALQADDKTLTTLAASPVEEVQRLVVPHFFVGSEGMTTRLHLINAGEAPAEADVLIYDDGGRLSGALPRELPARSRRTIDLSQATTVAGGYLRIELDGDLSIAKSQPAQVAAAVEYRGGVLNTRSTLAPLTTGSSRTVFLQVASADTPIRIFQGLALVSLESVTVRATVRAWDENGRLAAEREVEVPPRARLIGLLDEAVFFGAGFTQTGGHLEVVSDRPLYAYSLFGGDQFLSAVEGVISDR